MRQCPKRTASFLAPSSSHAHGAPPSTPPTLSATWWVWVGGKGCRLFVLALGATTDRSVQGLLRSPSFGSPSPLYKALVADFKFYTDVGGSSLSTTVEKMTTRFANVQDIFQTENQITVQSVSIGIKIGRLEVVDNSGDTRFVPNVGEEGDGLKFLQKFANQDWDEYCLAHLFTNYGTEQGEEMEI